MSTFLEKTNSLKGSKYIVQGNEAFALGVVHAGYHAADGYPGTPSTEVIDKYLSNVKDKMIVGWSISEATAVGVAVGHSIAGNDTIVTMKIPGVFQAGDTISTSAFYSVQRGALVYYIASDYVPSSTQHVVDIRYFLSSCKIPILEPGHHQSLYEAPFYAAEISKKFGTPVAIVASGILAHSEGLVEIKEKQERSPLPIPESLDSWMLLPKIARKNYDLAVTRRIPLIKEWSKNTNLISNYEGKDPWGVIVCGKALMNVREVLSIIKQDPSILVLNMTFPISLDIISDFVNKVNGKVLLVEDGEKFLQKEIMASGVSIIGKEDHSTITDWHTNDIFSFFSQYIKFESEKFTFKRENPSIKPLKRPPSICPGCPYKAIALTIKKLRKQHKIYASFGDIGCSTLLYFNGGIDTVFCMGASDSMRQGLVLAHPEMASKVVSIIGDSCECHSGLDSTRNSVFRNVPGLKIILDNHSVAMTGGQRAPSSANNFDGIPNKFELEDALRAEKTRTIKVDSYNMSQIESEIVESLRMAKEENVFTTMIVDGPCVQERKSLDRKPSLQINLDSCKHCGLCNICPGISMDENKNVYFTNLCNNCGGHEPICEQKCLFGAIVPKEVKNQNQGSGQFNNTKQYSFKKDNKEYKNLPDSMRVAIRGIGGQGNLFFGKVLAEVALLTNYKVKNIVKGDTHGMAQLGGSVISTFACGNVFSSSLMNGSADVLVAMELQEILQEGFLDLLKPKGKIIFNNLGLSPVNTKKEEYPSADKILNYVRGLDIDVIKIDANDWAYSLGDTTGRAANVIVIGLLSRLDPFCRIAQDIWMEALRKVSKNDYIWNLNYRAFQRGANL